MHSKNNDISGFETGDLVKHRRYTLHLSGIGIVLNVKPITSGYDVQVLWADTRVANHHSSCLESI